MRLAEFKTRLFIFFAGRLLKWAESIEQKIDPQQLPLVDDSKRFVPADSSAEGEAASSPPEHWARLTTSGPPQHWLDVINQKAPHLLSPTGTELLSTEAGERVSGPDTFQTETNPPPLSERDAVSGSQLSHAERNKSSETGESSAKPRSKSWLNRLHFRPPMSSLDEGKVEFVDSRRSGRTASSIAGGAVEGTATPRHSRLASTKPVDEMSDATVEGMAALRDMIVRLSRSLSNKAHRSDPFGYHHPNPKSGSQRARNEPEPQQRLAAHSLRQSLSSLVISEAENDTSSDVPRKADHSYVTNPHSITSHEATEDHAVESVGTKPDTNLRKLDRSSVERFAKHEGQRPSLRLAQQPTVEPSAAEPAASFHETQQRRTRMTGEVALNALEAKTRVGRRSPSSTSGLFKPSVNSVTNLQRASKEFASINRATARPNELKTEARENTWPALPLPPAFELADELAAMEREAERLQRLEHEQRGNPWNA